MFEQIHFPTLFNYTTFKNYVNAINFFVVNWKAITTIIAQMRIRSNCVILLLSFNLIIFQNAFENEIFI